MATNPDRSMENSISVFRADRGVTVIRDVETPREYTWETRMSGDFVTHVRAQVQDRLKIGDRIHNELFDEPRVVTRVDPVILVEGLSHWKAAIVPRSEWFRQHGKDHSTAGRVSQRSRQGMETFPDAHHPKFMYHATLSPVQVSSQQDIDKLGPGWSETYIHQEYPKVKHHWSGKTATVKSLDEEVALGGGWANSPAEFDPYKGQRRTRTERQNPIKWVDDWAVPNLSPEHRKKIKAQLLRAHAAFWASPESVSADLTSMKVAFGGVAKVLFEAGVLSEQLLQGEIPAFVWDSAIAGAWYLFASETPETIFPERLGHYYVWRDEAKDWGGLFRAETAEWLATLLEVPVELRSAAEANDQPGALPSPSSGQLEEARIPNTPTAGGSNGLLSEPEERVSEYMRRHPGTTYADIKYSAKVHTADFRDWRHGRLKTDSVMSQRIEAVLSGATPLKKKPPKRRAE